MSPWVNHQQLGTIGFERCFIFVALGEQQHCSTPQDEEDETNEEVLESGIKHKL